MVADCDPETTEEVHDDGIGYPVACDGYIKEAPEGDDVGKGDENEWERVNSCDIELSHGVVIGTIGLIPDANFVLGVFWFSV